MRLVDHVLQPATFWRRTDLRLDTSLHFAFDWKFFVELLKRGAKLVHLPHPLAKYRLQHSGKTVQDSAKRRGELVRVLEFTGAPWPYRLWAKLIWFAFLLSERSGLRLVKRLARVANTLAYFATGRRIAG